MLVELDYNLTVPTMWQFLTSLIGGERMDTMRHGAEYLAEQTLMCAKVAGFRPSMQAAACVYLSRRVLGAQFVWTDELAQLSSYGENDLVDVVHVLDDYMKKVCAQALHGSAVKLLFIMRQYCWLSKRNPKYSDTIRLFFLIR